MALARDMVRAHRRTLATALAGALGYLVAVVAVPLVSRQAVDDTLVDGRSARVAPYVAALIGLGALRALAGALRKYQATKFMAEIGADLRGRLYRHLQRLSFASHRRLGVGQLMARISGDVTTFEHVMSSIPFLAQSALMGVIGAVALLFIHPGLASAVLVTLGFTAALALRRAGSLQATSRDVQAATGSYAQFAEQQVAGIAVVKGFGAEATGLRLGTESSAAIADAGAALGRARGSFLGLFLGVPSAGFVIVVGLGGWMATTGRLSPGDLFAFLQFLSILTAPISVAASSLGQWYQASAGGERIAEVLAIHPSPVESRHAKPLPAGQGHLVIERVTFGYHPDQAVLRDLSLNVPAGTALALVGPSGSGKTTLANLVPRFDDPWTGAVRIDGVPVSELRLPDLRAAVAMVFEDTVLFSGTIRSNIALGVSDAGDHEIEEAARLAHADPFIRDLPEGYDTPVGERGIGLSGGQRQRLAIARAILRHPRILILDDATSAVDPHTEAEVRKGLVKAMRDRTTLIIAHRIETARLADWVVLLDGGQIRREGTHDELMRHAEYRKALGAATRQEQAS